MNQRVTPGPVDLRLEAEARLCDPHATSPGKPAGGPSRDEHELQIHQLELEMQNNQLHTQLDELLRWQKLMLDREGRVQELKAEVNELLAQLDLPMRYSKPD